MRLRSAMAIVERKRIAIAVGCGGFLVGLAYLVLKAKVVSGTAGYDFRYLWVAANVWAAGANPYAESFVEFAARAIGEGHVPQLWSYPPSWWPLAIVLPLEDLLAANWLFNLASIAMLLVSALIVGTVSAALWQRSGLGPVPGHIVFALQGIAFFALAATEATAIHLSVGQTTMLPVLGGALLLLGQHRGVAAWRILGFVLLMLKPQLGLPFVAAHFVASPRPLRDLVPAGLLSLALAMPAVAADPGTIADFLRNATAYKDVSIANHPAATTGLRSAVHALTGVEIGNFVPLAVSCLGSMALVWHHGGRRADPAVVVPLATLPVLALGPLHYYDFTLVLLALPLFAALPGPWLWLMAIGYALIFRADNVGAAIGFYDRDVGIFEGSWLSTVGAGLMLLAAIGRPARQPRAAAG